MDPVTENHRHPTPVPPNGETPLPTWVVTTGNDHDGYEIAALFADGHGAHRYGNLATHAIATAIPEEIDFYPTGTWRQPTHLHLTETDVAPSPSGSPPGHPRSLIKPAMRDPTGSDRVTGSAEYVFGTDPTVS